MRIYKYFLAILLLMSSLQAVSIKLDGSGGLSSGIDCKTGAIYRFGTQNSYEGKNIELKVEVINADNDYNDGTNKCTYVQGTTLATNLRDTDAGDNVAFEEYKITLVEVGTNTPIEVDRMMLTGYDLDTNGNSQTDTDDFYVSADGAYIASGSSVNHLKGNFFGTYTDKMKGWDVADCVDTEATPDPTCRASSIWIQGINGLNKVSSINVRVQNDNAYGEYSSTGYPFRLIQLSFKIEDFDTIFNGQKEYGDAALTYGQAAGNLDGTIMLGHGLAADSEASYQASAHADADDTDIGSENYNDDDAVTLSSATIKGQSLTAGTTITIDVATYGSGYLQAWFDWNGDGDFLDSGEHVINSHQVTNNGESTNGITNTTATNGVSHTPFTFTIPNTVKHGTSFARFRFSQGDTIDEKNPQTNLNLKGEVEDYEIHIIAKGSISGFVKDNNANPIPHITLSIRSGTTIVNDINGNPLTTQTDVNGSYTFIDVPLGDYQIVEEDNPLYTSQSDTASQDNDNTANTNTNDNVIPVTIEQGEQDTNNNFTDILTQQESISGIVKTSDNIPLAGATIKLTDTSYIQIPNTAIIITQADGLFSFTNLSPGDYVILEVDPAHYHSIGDDAGDENTSNTNPTDGKIPVTLQAHEIDTDNTFVDKAYQSIQGYVYADINADETPDHALANVTISLKSCDHSLTRTTNTDNNGSFEFLDLLEGCYTLTETDPVGYTSIKDSDGQKDNNLTINLGNNAPTPIFFIDEPSKSISGKVLVDTDYDDTAEKTLANVIIELYDFNTTLIQQTKTDSNGTYLFTNVTPGTYTLKEIDPSGYASLRDVDGANDNTIMIEMLTQNITNQNFEDQERVFIQGVIKVDINGDGIVDEPLENSQLIICLANMPCDINNNIAEVKSDENGIYRFDNLLPGEYQIVEIDKEGYQSLNDVDGANDNIIHVTLKPHENSINQNFNNELNTYQSIIIDKSVNKKQAHIGDFVSYSISVENINGYYDYLDVNIKDFLPAGFKYEKNSATIIRNDVSTPLSTRGNKILKFGSFDLAAQEKVIISYLLKVGVSVAKGKHTNTAVAMQHNKEVSNTSKASIMITADSFADNALVIGKVFFDKNKNGIQDCCEKGIPGVRLATVEGMLIETDGYGRYHVADVQSGGFMGRGSNFIVKVDPATLPEGTTFTTENPRVYRVTSGQLNVIDFGVYLPEVKAFSKEHNITKITIKKELVQVSKDIMIGSIYFDSDQNCIRPDQVKSLCKIADTIKQYQHGALRIEGNTDARAPMWYNKKLAYKRAQSVYKELRHRLGDSLMENVDVIYDNCSKEVKFDPRYDWWGKKNIPRSKKECTRFGISNKDCQRLLSTPKGGVL